MTPIAPPLTLLRGEEQLLVDRAAARAVATLRAADAATEKREAAAAGMTPGDFADLVAPSLFAEPRVVVIKGAHEAAKDLASAIVDYAQAPVAGVTLLVHHAGGARNKPLADALVKAGAAVINCIPITRAADRVEFVKAEVKAAGATTTAAAAAALVDAIGSDLPELASAVSQLVADTGGRVDEVAVSRYYTGRADASGFAVADLAIAGDAAGSLEALRWALNVGEPPVRIADALASGIRTVAKVAGSLGSSAQALASQWGMPPWRIDKARGPARAWSSTGLVSAMEIVTRLNAEVKGGAADAEFALERAVLAICAARRSSRD